MGFVHSDQRDRRTGGKVAESPGFQAFRGHVQQFDLPGGGLGEHHRLLVGSLSGVDERGRQTEVVQRIDLVAHQGNQGRYDQSHTRAERGGNLVAHGLACAGGHHAQDIASGKQNLDNSLLPGPKRVIAEVSCERLQRRLMCCHKRPV